MEVAEANVLWVQQHYGTIVNWLKSQKPAVTTQPTVSTTPSAASSVFLNNFFLLMAMAVFSGSWTLTRSCYIP